MPNARTAHELKSEAERQQYIATTTGRGQSSSTLDEPLIEIDTTDTAPATREKPRTSTYQPTVPESAATRIIREKWGDILIGIIVLALSVILGYVVSLNREIGELKIRQERDQKEFEKIEERLQKDIDKINDKLDRLSQSQQDKEKK